jgi:hypothetical protein
VDGDGNPDLDPARMSYFGLSFGGGALGPSFMAVEPDVRVGVLASPAGMNSRYDLLRMRPSARSEVGAVLASRTPPLINEPGLDSWAGIPVGVRKVPLPGMSPKRVLINFAKGDESAPNPRTAQLVRAGGFADVTTIYRNDLAYVEVERIDRG